MSGASEPREVEGAVFAWSLSEQSNARSHNPAAINFLAAGVADPGRGGATLPASAWAAVAGNTTIQKQDAGGAWQTATWQGLGTDASGTPIDLYGPFSGHRVHVASGTGIVDPVAEDASLAWTGTFTVVYYGGNTVFTISDPVLSLDGGSGEVTAEMGGWMADRHDPTTWRPVPGRRVAVATLSGVDVTESGLVATPAYRGVTVSGSVPQHRDGAHWGAFPAPMVEFLAPLGVDQFWYSTGLQSDWTKLPAPVVVGYDGTLPEAPATAPSASALATPKPPQVTNRVRPSPSGSPPSRLPQPAPGPVDTGSPGVPVAALPPAVVAGMPDAVADSPASAAAFAAQPVALQAAAGTDDREPVASGQPAVHPAWWGGGVLLLGAAGLLLVPGRRPT